ncbi:DUF5359 family protein [Peribacillus sp. B-H-3]|jgi:hypothetical protein|uniref:DUF5359 family protein n=1 Tax=Bacillaceae TaxID=186817 RepID=UPI0008F5D8BC|nr:DUF5359 family protein [Bacillus sp. MUM 13]OIK12352.1 hypothetical protein BIV59_09110 [Bacillus sp. MUM 13]
MKTVERLMVKLILIQLIFLILTQIWFNQAAPRELNKLVRYEGVNSNNYSKVIETFRGLDD